MESYRGKVTWSSVGPDLGPTFPVRSLDRQGKPTWLLKAYDGKIPEYVVEIIDMVDLKVIGWWTKNGNHPLVKNSVCLQKEKTPEQVIQDQKRSLQTSLADKMADVSRRQMEIFRLEQEARLPKVRIPGDPVARDE